MTRTSMVDFATAIEGVSAAESLHELERMFPDLCRSLEISHIVYHSLRPRLIGSQQPILLFTYDAGWVGRYFAERYLEIDPVVATGRRSFLPLDWAEVHQQDGQAGAFFKDSERHGVGRQGVTIPIRGPLGERALFTVNSTATPKVWEKTRSRFMPEFLTLGHFIHERAMRIACTRPAVLPRLSGRERQCLQFAAAGKPIKVIAHELGIAEPTVSIYLKSARHKLGAATITQAVAIALSMDFIEL